jgi:hypothetical protein
MMTDPSKTTLWDWFFAFGVCLIVLMVALTVIDSRMRHPPEDPKPDKGPVFFDGRFPR